MTSRTATSAGRNPRFQGENLEHDLEIVDSVRELAEEKDVTLLGHADPKTTMVYVDDTPADRERLMLLASDEPTTLDNDRAA